MFEAGLGGEKSIFGIFSYDFLFSYTFIVNSAEFRADQRTFIFKNSHGKNLKRKQSLVLHYTQYFPQSGDRRNKITRKITVRFP